MMKYPPAATTATGRMDVAVSENAWKMASWRNASSLACTSSLLATENLSISELSFANAFAVRMPDSEDSMAALISAVFAFTAMFASFMWRRRIMTSTASDGTRISMIAASRGSMVNMIAMAPRMVRTEITTSSGP